jgi:hypothetical protein
MPDIAPDACDTNPNTSTNRAEEINKKTADISPWQKTTIFNTPKNSENPMAIREY